MSIPNIIIVDYGVGNLHSVKRAFEHFKVSARVSSDISAIKSADAIILPGVGSFESGMRGLEQCSLIDPIKKISESKKPILGICLGAQLLLNKGLEFGEHKGLGIISGDVVKFPKFKDNEKVPHVGWNKIYPPNINLWNNTILKNIKNNSKVYFVHSFVLQPKRKDDILALSEYGGYEFCSAVKKGNIIGCQFHPEKSGKIGLDIIKSFIEFI